MSALDLDTLPDGTSTTDPTTIEAGSQTIKPSASIGLEASRPFLELNGDISTDGVSHVHGDLRDYMGPTLYQPHRARQAIRDAHKRKIAPLIGYYAGLPSVAITRWLSPFGYDFVWIDWEHCAMNVETMTTMVHETMFMSNGRTIPFVRVPGHDEAMIAFALDAGASIVAPHVDTVEQARKVIGALRFGSRRRVPGTRSAPPFRYVPGLTDDPAEPGLELWESLNNQAALMIQIETVEGINNLDAILTEAGDDIDVVWLGRLDARVSMGLKVEAMGVPDEPEWLVHEEKFFEVVKKHDKPYAGFSYTKGEAFLAQAEQMTMCTVHADAIKLWELLGDLNEYKQLAAKQVSR